jgi:hypothetical protein
LSGLKDQKYKDLLGTSIPELKGKNMKGVFRNKFAVGQTGTDYMWIARKELKPAMENFIKGSVDANTALRDAQEKANEKIAAEKEAKKSRMENKSK